MDIPDKPQITQGASIQEIESTHPRTNESSDSELVDDKGRGAHTYRKEAYLSSVLRHTYYQRLMTPSWSKYLVPASWKTSMKKWRYWTHLKNYVT